jgi:hypothetical protein
MLIVDVNLSPESLHGTFYFIGTLGTHGTNIFRELLKTYLTGKLKSILVDQKTSF